MLHLHPASRGFNESSFFLSLGSSIRGFLHRRRGWGLGSGFLGRGLRGCAGGSIRRKAPRQGANTLSKAKRLVKLSPKTWLNFLSLVFAPRVSFLSPMPHGLLARQRGAPSIALRGALTSRGLTHPRPCGALTLTYRSGGGVALREGPKT